MATNVGAGSVPRKSFGDRVTDKINWVLFRGWFEMQTAWHRHRFLMIAAVAATSLALFGLLWTLHQSFWFAVFLLTVTSAVWRLVVWKPKSPLGWLVVAALVVLFAVSFVGTLLSSTSSGQQVGRSGGQPAKHSVQPTLPSDPSGDKLSKIVIGSNSYSVTGGVLESVPMVDVPVNAPHKVGIPVQVFVTGLDRGPRSGLAVSINGQDGKTGSDGSFTAPKVVFENKTPGKSSRFDLMVKLGSGQPLPIETWTLNLLDGPVGSPALTRQQAMEMLTNPQFVSSLRAMCPTVGVTDVVGVEQTRSTGQSMIAVGQNGQLVNSSDQIPVGQPVWSFKLAAGKSFDGQPSCFVMVNPVCQNIAGKVPGNSPSAPVPTAPLNGPTSTPTPMSPPTVAPAPTKNPGNGPVQTFATPPPPAATSAPTYAPPPQQGTTISVPTVSCRSGSCTFSWSAPNTSSGWIRWGKAANGLDHNDTAPQTGGSYSVTEPNFVPGVSYDVVVYATGSIHNSTMFTAS